MNEVRWFTLVVIAVVAGFALCDIANALTRLADSYCDLADGFMDNA